MNNNVMHSLLIKVYQMQYPDESLITNRIEDATHRGFRKFYEDFIDKTPDSITWNYISEYVQQTNYEKQCLNLTLVLLDNGYGLNDHKEALLRLYPQLLALSRKSSIKSISEVFVADKIDDTFIYDIADDVNWMENNKRFIIYLPYKNKCIQNEVFQHYKTSDGKYYIPKFSMNFEDSLEEIAKDINSYKDFNDTTFWAQANYFMNNDELTPKELTRCLRLLIMFYRYLVNKHTDHRYFDNTLHMSESLLFSENLFVRIKQGYYVMPFSTDANYHNYKRIIFLLRGYGSLSTRIKNDDYKAVDLSAIKSSFYRNELFRYYVSMPSVTVVTALGQIIHARDALAMIEDVKSQKGYPNPAQDYMNNQEAVFIRSFYSDESIKLASRNNKIGAIRRFLLWERGEHKITFDDMFFEYLVQYEEPSMNHGKAIPDDHVAMISERLAHQASSSHEMDLTYAAFHLALETEFRISQICHLTVDCIKPSAKPHEYIIQSYHKSGHGRLDSFVISEQTYRHIMRIIENTEPYREKCKRKDLLNYIFLYDGTGNTVSLMNSNKFRLWFQETCASLGLPKYTSVNIRDTHMTKSFEYVLRHGKSDLVMSALSKHKYLDTTKSHYIEQRLDEMLEATYGVIIGDLDDCYNPSTHITDIIPKDINKKEHIVENGCGNCKSAQCTMKNALPCLICDHFITTVEHEPAFRRAIEAVDKLIQQSNTKHDKDDLTTIKVLLVMYLKSIYQIKEEMAKE